MPGKFENVATRHDFILRQIPERGEVAVDELCLALEASTTIQEAEFLRVMARHTKKRAVRKGH